MLAVVDLQAFFHFDEYLLLVIVGYSENVLEYLLVDIGERDMPTSHSTFGYSEEFDQ